MDTTPGPGMADSNTTVAMIEGQIVVTKFLIYKEQNIYFNKFVGLDLKVHCPCTIR